MTMKSMALGQKERKKYALEPCGSDRNKGPKYPWGLRLDLEDETLKKLGIDVSELSSGSEVTLRGKAMISGISVNDSDGKKRSSLSLQITHLELPVEGDFAAAFKARAAKGKK